MGRYIDWNDVVNKYPDLAKLSGAETVNSAWIYGAEAEVDARLAAKYTVPFTNSPAPDLVRDLASDLVYYKAMIRQKSVQPLYEYINDRFEALIAGTMVIPNASGGASGSSALIGLSDRGTAFGLDSPLEWRPSCDARDLAEEDRT